MTPATYSAVILVMLLLLINLPLVLMLQLIGLSQLSSGASILIAASCNIATASCMRIVVIDSYLPESEAVVVLASARVPMGQWRPHVLDVLHGQG